MDFFEKPKLVTAVVFFAQTILAMLNMRMFLFSGAFILVLIPFFFGFPFAFYYTYKFIIEELDKDNETEKEKIPVNFTMKNPDVPEQNKPEPNTENEQGKEALHPIEKKPEETLVSPEPESGESTISEESAPLKNPKYIQVVDVNDVFLDEETISGAGKPVTRASLHRPKTNQEASKEALNPSTETETVETPEEPAEPQHTEDQERA